MLDGHPVAYFIPSYKMLAEVWRQIKGILSPIIVKADGSNFRMELETGGVLDMWSLENAGAARGRKYKKARVDEAAHSPNLKDAIENVILPTLTDLSGGLDLASTPNGREYFFELAMREDDKWRHHHAPTTNNPHINPAEVELMRDVMGDIAYRQEYLAEFLESEGLVFRGVTAAATAEEGTSPIPGRTYVAGADWGMTHDFTVITVIDVEDQRVVDQIRFTNREFKEQLERAVELYSKWGMTTILAELNSIGRPFVTEMQRKGLPVQGFTTTNATKAAIIQSLALAIETGKIRIPNDPGLVGELMAYQCERLPSGLLRYGAPEGLHDDRVISLALAYAAANKNDTKKRKITVSRY